VVLQPAAILHGRALDEVTGNPAANAFIYMQDAHHSVEGGGWHQARADAEGKYRLGSLAAEGFLVGVAGKLATERRLVPVRRTCREALCLQARREILQGLLNTLHLAEHAAWRRRDATILRHPCGAPAAGG
jgi:hypothetical protein